MKRTLFTTLVCGSFLLLPVTVSSFDGPLQVRNQLPLFLSINPPFLESAAVQDSMSVRLTHSSVYMTTHAPSWTVNMDLELTELAVRIKKKVGDRSEIGLDVPVLRPTGGFFDRPLADFHKTLGTRDYDRHKRPNNAFLYEVLFEGRPVIQPVNDRAGIGDARITFKQVVFDDASLVSILADIELPTGDAKTGYGNGSLDAALAVLVDRKLTEKCRAYGNIGIIFPGDLKGYETIPLRNAVYGGFGAEAAWREHFSIIVQTLVQTSPYPKTGIRQVDWPGVLLTFGGRYSSGSGSIELSLTEDPDTAGAPDFMVNVTGKMNF